MESSLELVSDKLSSVEEKLSKTNPPVASTHPPPPTSTATDQANDDDMEPTQPAPNSVTTVSDVDSTASSTAPLVKEANVSSTGEGQNTNIPTGEPTTPLTESTESRGTGATGDVPRTEGPVVFNMSSEASDGEMTNGSIISSTESEGTTTMEGATATTAEEAPPPPDSEELDDEKITNEQAIAALQSK